MIHPMQELAIGTMLLKVGEEALPEITKLVEAKEEGKPITFREIWPLIEQVGKGISTSSLGTVPLLHGRKPKG